MTSSVASLPPLLGLPLTAVSFGSCAVGDVEGGSVDCEQSFMCLLLFGGCSVALEQSDLTVDRLANRWWKQCDCLEDCCRSQQHVEDPDVPPSPGSPCRELRGLVLVLKSRTDHRVPNRGGNDRRHNGVRDAGDHHDS